MADCEAGKHSLPSCLQHSAASTCLFRIDRPKLDVCVEIEMELLLVILNVSKIAFDDEVVLSDLQKDSIVSDVVYKWMVFPCEDIHYQWSQC